MEKRFVAGLAGEIGVRGATGDFNDREGREVLAVAMLKESLGLAAERSILNKKFTERRISNIFVI